MKAKKGSTIVHGGAGRGAASIHNLGKEKWLWAGGPMGVESPWNEVRFEWAFEGRGVEERIWLEVH